MAVEKSRTVSVRRIYAPGEEESDGTHVDIKVIDSITFVDPKAGYQEWVFTYKNDPESARTVEIKEVGDDKLKVERILTLTKVEPKSGYQETKSTYSNWPETAHLETRKVKIYALNDDKKTKNESIWVEVERIDRISFVDPKDGYQETVYELANPDKTDPEWDYTDLKEPLYKNTGQINPPYRMDPFQNIVDCQFGGCLVVFYGSNSIAAISMSSLEKGTIKATSKKTLSNSSWQPSWDCKLFKTQQLKFSKDQSIILSPLKGLSTGRVSYSDKFVLTSSKFKGERVTDGLSTYENPFFCGSDAVLHLNSGDASISSSGLVSSYTKWTAPAGENAYAAFIVTGSGERYYGFGGLNTSWGADEYVYAFMDWVSSYQPAEWHSYERPLDIPMQPTYGSTYSSYYTIGIDDYQTKQDEIYDRLLPQGVGMRGYIAFYKGGTLNFDYTASYGDDRFGTTTTKGSMSATLEYASHQNISGKSELTFKSFTINCSAALPLRQDGSVSINVGGFYSSSSPAPYYEDTQTQRPDVAVVFWPPTTQGSPPWLYIRDAAQGTWPPYDLANGVEKIVTPYGEIQSSYWDYNSDYDFAISPSFHPWLHLSDGKNLIQACEFGGKRYIWINGSEKSAAIAAAIGCDVKDIRTMLLDVSIGKLK